VDALSGPATQVLAVVAVAGRRLPHRLLAMAAGLDDQELTEALHAAVTNHLLVMSPGRDGYDLRHALLREAVNADLLPGERTRLHARLARALAAHPELAGVSAATVAAELAMHWDSAGEPARALRAHIQAGQAAEDAHAFPEALGHYQRCLELWALRARPGRPGGMDRVELLSHAAEAAASTGATERAIALLEEAVDRADKTAEPVRTAGLLAQLGFHRFRARPETAVFAAYDTAEQLLAGTPASAEQARVYGFRAHALWVSGRPHAAEPFCERAIVAAQAAGAVAEEAHAVRVLGGCLGDLGEFGQAVSLTLKARQLAEQAGTTDVVIATYVSLTSMLSLAGREREALAAGHEGYRRARELGHARSRGSFVANNLAGSMLALGLWEELDELTAELLGGDCWCGFGLHGTRGLLLARRGHFTPARAEAERALELCPDAFRDDGLLPLAELAIWQGRHDQAAGAVAEGLEHATETEEDLQHRFGIWYALALRVEADRAEQATARRIPEQADAARRRAAPVIAALDRLAAWDRLDRYPKVGCTLELARAELARLQGRSDPERWQAAALAWEQQEGPFEAAYARFRQAEALLASHAPRPQALPPLQTAHRTATRLRAAPLQREIELLAQRGRLRLDTTVPQVGTATTMSPAAPFGLTRREAEVLALLAEGRTNRQIGEALFITPKTASIHVSRILAKLGVAGRGEAAAAAHRLGLDKH